MKYDLFATFYEKESDEKFRFKVFIKTVRPRSEKFFVKNGFCEDTIGDNGMVNYIKRSVNQRDLEMLTSEEHIPEVLEVLSCGYDYELINITAIGIKIEPFYERLSSGGKCHYDAQERVRPHTERFKELMNQTEKSEGAGKYMFFTSEEIDYLGKEDLVTLGDLHESEAWYYMND